MYYVLVIIFLIVTYFALAKILSSILKGCLVTVGLGIIILVAFFFLKSAKEPVILFDRYVIDNFEIYNVKEL